MTSIIMPVMVLTDRIRAVTKEAIYRVMSLTPEPYEILVVDNGSTQPKTEWAGPRMQIRQFYEPTGLGNAGAWNYGLERAQGDLLVVMDNDVYVPEKWHEGMEGALQDGVGVVVPARSDQPGDDLTGCMMMFRRSLKEQIGGQWFDPAFSTAYFEDTDLFKRVKTAGLKRVLAPVTIEHVNGLTTKQSGLDLESYYRENEGRYRAKWGLSEDADIVEDLRR